MLFSADFTEVKAALNKNSRPVLKLTADFYTIIIAFFTGGVKVFY